MFPAKSDDNIHNAILSVMGLKEEEQQWRDQSLTKKSLKKA